MYESRWAAIQQAIEIAWATEDPATRAAQVSLIGGTYVPSPEEIILKIAQKILDNHAIANYHHGMGSDR